MTALLKDLLRDEYGFLISAELVIVGTVLVLGLMTGMACLQDSLVKEYKDLASAFGSLDQSYHFVGMHGCLSSCGRSSWTAGSVYGARLEVTPTFGIYVPPATVPPCPAVEVPCPQPTPPEMPCQSPCPMETACPCRSSLGPVGPVLPPCGPAPCTPCVPTPHGTTMTRDGVELPYGSELRGPVVW